MIPITARELSRAAAYAVGIALAFCYVLGRYWAFNHLSIGGGFALIVLLLPVSLIASIILAITLTFLFMSRRIPAQRAVRLSVGAVGVVALAMLASEIHRTRDARSGEGIGAGDLGPFFRALITLR